MEYTSIFDSHAHYDDAKFDEDRDELISSLPSKGIIGVINCGADLKSSAQSVKLSEKYDYIYAAVGVHPHEAKDFGDDTLNELRRLAANKKVVAIGEIGLDYYYDFSPREKQIEVFEKQLILAAELNLPVIIHNRDAHEDTLNILKKHRPKGVLHCFSGSAETAREIVKLGMFIGLGGAVTFKNAKKPLEVAATVPDEFLLIETDAPYMAPVPFRGKRCDSAMIPYTAEKIAEVRNTTAQEFLNLTAENAKRLFGID
ncbi:MAG TPA: TatD family hydrolase [Clostridiales bacterium]|nr:TatD family hydrolase [Clostridiales bacterium]HOJ35146.1 TatD family hydrolase [Clostridiales bacterium]HPP68435.1 TatD family hydrolase [Clostridiales bacterium]